MQELPEFPVAAGEGVQGLEAVDDDQARAPLLEHRGDPLSGAGEPVAAGGLAEVLIEQRPADRGGVEEV
jgi:hypothetical protein